MAAWQCNNIESIFKLTHIEQQQYTIFSIQYEECLYNFLIEKLLTDDSMLVDFGIWYLSIWWSSKTVGVRLAQSKQSSE